MSLSDEDILKQIQTELTQRLWDRLLLYAAELIRVNTWHGILGGPPLHGNCAADYVNIAVQKTLSACRAWEPEKCTLEMHLKGAIRSEISHAHERVENRRLLRARSLANELDDEQECPLDTFPGSSPTPEEAEWLKEREEALLDFLDALSDDIPVQRLFELIHDGVVKRAEQAKALQMTETQVDVIKKRFSTRVRRYASNRNQKVKGVTNA